VKRGKNLKGSMVGNRALSDEGVEKKGKCEIKLLEPASIKISVREGPYRD